MEYTIPNKQKADKMNFRDYYSYLQKLPNALRNEIIRKLEISQKTFYDKLNGDSFSYPEKLVIAKVMDRPVEVLFPGTTIIQ